MRLCLDLQDSDLLATIDGGTLSFKRSMAYQPQRVAELATELTAVLERSKRTHTLTDSALERMRRIGEQLAILLVHPEVAEQLSTDLPLTLQLDESLLELPWELLHDGKGFWSQRFDLGRAVITAQSGRSSAAPPPQSPLRMLLVASDPRHDLPHVSKEAERLVEQLDHAQSVDVSLLADPTVEQVRRQLKEYDIVHFAGHAEFHASQPQQSGWLLADGTLTAEDVLDLSTGRAMPFLVFSNACRSGETATGRDDTAHGLANAFLRAGVRLYVGTRAEVVDAESHALAATFYQALGRGASAGMAMRVARNEALAQQRLAWASYVLYGDPSLPLLLPTSYLDNRDLLAASSLDSTASLPRKRPITGALRPPSFATEEKPAPKATDKRTRLIVAVAAFSSLVALTGLGLVIWLLTQGGDVVDPPGTSGLQFEQGKEQAQIAPKLAVLLMGDRLTCLERATRRRFELTPRARIEPQLTTTALLPKQAQRIARAVGAELVVFEAPDRKVVAMDVLTAESPVRGGLTNALSCDAFSGEMVRVFLGEGQVISADKDRVTVNLGWRSRVAPGLVLTLLRDGRPSGSLIVDRVELDSSVCRGKAKPGDVVRLRR